MSIELTKHQQIVEQIGTMRNLLLQGNPNFSSMLRTIHTNLSKDKDVVTLLSEEDIGSLVSGLMAQTGVVITAAAAKKSKSAKAGTKGFTLEDLL